MCVLLLLFVFWGFGVRMWCFFVWLFGFFFNSLHPEELVDPVAGQIWWLFLFPSVALQILSGLPLLQPSSWGRACSVHEKG